MLIQPPGSLGTLDILFSKCKAKAATHQLCGRKRTRPGIPLLPVGMYLGVFPEHITNCHWRRAVISHQTTTAGCWTVVTQVLVLLLTPESAKWKETREPAPCLKPPTQLGQGCSLKRATCYQTQPPRWSSSTANLPLWDSLEATWAYDILQLSKS